MKKTQLIVHPIFASMTLTLWYIPPLGLFSDERIAQPIGHRYCKSIKDVIDLFKCCHPQKSLYCYKQ